MLAHLKILISINTVSNVTLQESAQKVKKKELLRADFCFKVYMRYISCVEDNMEILFPRMNGGERKRRQSYVEGIFVDMGTLKI